MAKKRAILRQPHPKTRKLLRHPPKNDEELGPTRHNIAVDKLYETRDEGPVIENAKVNAGRKLIVTGKVHPPIKGSYEGEARIEDWESGEFWFFALEKRRDANNEDPTEDWAVSIPPGRLPPDKKLVITIYRFDLYDTSCVVEITTAP